LWKPWRVKAAEESGYARDGRSGQHAVVHLSEFV
jgi:hypothetical protein